MALASPAQALASVAPLAFTFPSRKSVKAQVRFYEDAEATEGNEIPPSATGGSRVLTATLTTQVADVPLEYIQRELESAIVNGTQTCDGATWYEFDLSDGASSLTIAATAGANPTAPSALALGYRIILDVEANG